MIHSNWFLIFVIFNGSLLFSTWLALIFWIDTQDTQFSFAINFTNYAKKKRIAYIFRRNNFRLNWSKRSVDFTHVYIFYPGKKNRTNTFLLNKGGTQKPFKTSRERETDENCVMIRVQSSRYALRGEKGRAWPKLNLTQLVRAERKKKKKKLFIFSFSNSPRVKN